MNKVKTLKLNILTSVLPWVVLAVVGFIKIKFFINAYGSELNGFIQLIAQIYGYISLVELGFGSAITYKLYKPLADGNKEEVAKLFNGAKKIYKNVAIKMLILGILTAVVLPFILKYKTLEIYTILAVFLLYALDYLLKYILDLPCRILLYADQKRYKANIIVNISTLIIKIIEVLLILTSINYIIVLAAIIALNTISYLILNSFTKKEYPWMKSTKEIDLTAKEMSKDVMAHKISRIVFYGTDNIIISTTNGLGLAVASIYGSYNYIIAAIRSILDLFLTSPLELLGNKFAKGKQNKEGNYSLYREFVKATYFLGIIISATFFVCMGNLVEVWINKGYVLDTVTTFVFSIYIWYECISRTNLTMIEANGKYKETKYIEIIAVILNIVLSLILVRYLGIMGVVLATVIALMLIKQPLQTRFLYKNIFNKKIIKSMLIFVLYTIFMISICFLNTYIVKLFSLFIAKTFIAWIIGTLIILVIDSIITFLSMYLLDKSFKLAVKRFLNKQKA